MCFDTFYGRMRRCRTYNRYFPVSTGVVMDVRRGVKSSKECRYKKKEKEEENEER